VVVVADFMSLAFDGNVHVLDVYIGANCPLRVVKHFTVDNLDGNYLASVDSLVKLLSLSKKAIIKAISVLGGDGGDGTGTNHPVAGSAGVEIWGGVTVPSLESNVLLQANELWLGLRHAALLMVRQRSTAISSMSPLENVLVNMIVSHIQAKVSNHVDAAMSAAVGAHEDPVDTAHSVRPAMAKAGGQPAKRKRRESTADDSERSRLLAAQNEALSNPLRRQLSALARDARKDRLKREREVVDSFALDGAKMHNCRVRVGDNAKIVWFDPPSVYFEPQCDKEEADKRRTEYARIHRASETPLARYFVVDRERLLALCAALSMPTGVEFDDFDLRFIGNVPVVYYKRFGEQQRFALDALVSDSNARCADGSSSSHDFEVAPRAKTSNLYCLNVMIPAAAFMSSTNPSSFFKTLSLLTPSFSMGSMLNLSVSRFSGGAGVAWRLFYLAVERVYDELMQESLSTLIHHFATHQAVLTFDGRHSRSQRRVRGGSTSAAPDATVTVFDAASSLIVWSQSGELSHYTSEEHAVHFTQSGMASKKLEDHLTHLALVRLRDALEARDGFCKEWWEHVQVVSDDSSTGQAIVRQVLPLVKATHLHLDAWHSVIKVPGVIRSGMDKFGVRNSVTKKLRAPFDAWADSIYDHFIASVYESAHGGNHEEKLLAMQQRFDLPFGFEALATGMVDAAMLRSIRELLRPRLTRLAGANVTGANNESFHSYLLQFTSKGIACRVAYRYRIMIAVLSWNAFRDNRFRFFAEKILDSFHTLLLADERIEHVAATVTNVACSCEECEARHA